MSSATAIAELCHVEANDDLHEFGGGHGNKGNDFARFWLIKELFSLTEAGAQDYLFILEYVQDVAKVNAADSPSSITLYQLKKKEGGVWDLNSLAGLTQKGKAVKPDSPLAKLLKSVLGFSELSVDAEFVSNTRYKVDLAVGGNALQMDFVSLSELKAERQEHFRESASVKHSIPAESVPLDKVGLRYAPIEVNDMRVHVIGVAHGMLKKISAEHAAQADSLVDALFAKLATASRNTTKCKSWEELVSKRGFSKQQFQEAIKSLQLLPDQQKRREELLSELSKLLGWSIRDSMRVEVALTELARLKLVGGELSIKDVDWCQLQNISDSSEMLDWSVSKEYETVESALQIYLPDETSSRIRALTIYAMVKAWTNQMFV